MIRREFVKFAFAAGAGAALSTGALKSATIDLPRIKPRALRKGDTVALIAPGTNVTDPDDMQKAFAAIEYLGLKVKLLKRHDYDGGYKSRTVKARVDELHEAFSDTGIQAVMCLRGGYASAQLLDSIDYSLIAKNPKIFVGYSDITAMHLAISRFSGLITFHGPVALSAFTKFTLENFEKILFGGETGIVLRNPHTESVIRPPHHLITISSGKATGELTGGNLSLVCSLMGTPYEIDSRDKILFLEDVGEEPYRIDRMLNQLRLAGKLSEAKGVVFGECAECDSNGLKPSRVWDFSLGEVLDNYLSKLGVPVFHGLTIGHTSDQLTVPYGIKAEIDADSKTITLMEKPVE